MHRNRVLPLLAGLLLAGAAPLLDVAPAAAAAATTQYVVTTTDDVVDANDGVLSLREAFTSSTTDAGESEIVLAAGATYDLTICNAAVPEHLNADGDLDLGNAAGLTTITGNDATIHQTCQLERVILTESPLVVRHLILSGGSNDTGSSTGEGNGGGIYGYSTVTVEDSTITGNAASGHSAVYAGGDVTILRSTITANTASASGPGVATAGVTGDVTIIDSTIAGNTGASPSAAHAGASLTVRNSTISNNTGTTSNIFLSVLSGNAGITLEHVTLAGNAHASGPSLIGPTLDLTTTVLADTATGKVCGNGSVVTSHGGNVIADNSCGTPAATDQTQVADAGLGALADNGGPTLTQLPTVTSPVLGVLPAAACSATLTLDQRGLPRPDGRCDAGAVELQRRPDALLRLGLHPFRGDEVRNTTGANQTVTAVVARGGTGIFVLRAENDGEVSDALTLRGGVGRGAVTARYTRAGSDVTRAFRSGYAASRPAHTAITVTARIHVAATAPHGLVRRFPLTVRSSSGAVDKVVAVVRVR